MKINEKWSIESGGECYVVVETRKGTNPKTGEPTETKVRTYHPTLNRCGRKIADSETLSMLEVGDLIHAVYDFDAAADRIVAAIKGLKIQEQTA